MKKRLSLAMPVAAVLALGITAPAHAGPTITQTQSHSWHSERGGNGHHYGWGRGRGHDRDDRGNRHGWDRDRWDRDREDPAPEPETPQDPEPETPAPAQPEDPQPAQPQDPDTGEGTTGGAGGERSDRLAQRFTSNGMTSDYHIFAGGLDWSKPVGILMYGDGSGGHGYDNPNSDYLLDADGTDGLVAVAKRHNLLLVTPNAPAPGCDGLDNCWYDNDLGTAAAKAQWSSDLMSQVKSQYPIDTDRVVIGGYSSGAQWTTRTFLPAHGEEQSVDLAVAIGYGGDARGPITASPEWKNDVVISWDTGKRDPAYTAAGYGALGGYNAYTRLGFTTDYLWPDTEGHSRGRQFDDIIERELTEHLQPAQ